MWTVSPPPYAGALSKPEHFAALPVVRQANGSGLTARLGAWSAAHAIRAVRSIS